MLAAPLTSPPLASVSHFDSTYITTNRPIPMMSISGPIMPLPQPQLDAHGRQINFEESVRQRQERLTYLRRQDLARRHAAFGYPLSANAVASSSKSTSPTRRSTPAERVLAATSIQRAFRAYLARRKASEGVRTVQAELKRIHRAFPIDSISVDSKSSSSKYDTSLPLAQQKDREQRVHARLLRLQSTTQAIQLTFQRSLSSPSSSVSRRRQSSSTRSHPRTPIQPKATRHLQGTLASLAFKLTADIEIMQHITLERCVRELRDAHRRVLSAIDEEVISASASASAGGLSPKSKTKALANPFADPRSSSKKHGKEREDELRRIRSAPVLLYDSSSIGEAPVPAPVRSAGLRQGRPRSRLSLPSSLEDIEEDEEA